MMVTPRYHQGGHIFDAMVDFTGGYSEYRMLDKDAGTSDQEEVFSTLLRYHERGSLLGCGIFPRDGDGVETSIGRASNQGLRRFHNHTEALEGTLKQPGDGPSRDLLCDCEIFTNLRLKL